MPTIDKASAFSPTRPWPLGVNYQSIAYCGVGLCAPELQDSVRGMEPFAYDTGLFNFVMGATPINTTTGASSLVNVDGDDLFAQAGETLQLFRAGVGDTIAQSTGNFTGTNGGSAWYTKTISDTDTFPGGGAPVDRGFLMMVSGISVEALDPFQRGGSGTATSDPQLYSSWLEMQEDGPGYSQRIQKHLLNMLGITVAFGNTGTTYRLGTPAHHPSQGGPSGSQAVTNGRISTPGVYLPLMTSFCIGAIDEVRQLALNLTLGTQVEIQSDATNPTIAGSTLSGSINVANKGDVYAPIRVNLYGKTVCAPPNGACGLTDLDALRAGLAQLGMQVPG
jgi:hypothetical protein